MLDRHIKVGKQHVVLSHHIDHAQRERTRIDVKHPQPSQVRYLLHDHFEQVGQTVLHTDIGAITNGVLSDEHDFFRAAGHDIDDLLQDVKWTFADLSALDAWNRAERA